MSFSLISLTNEHMIRQRISMPRQSHWYPSEASVCWIDKNGEKRAAGTCLRAAYFRYTGAFPAAQKEPYSEWIFALGKAVEEILVEQYKQMGLWVANNIDFYWPEYNIKGEIDVILVEPGTNTQFAVECCTQNSLLLSKDYRLYQIDTAFSEVNEVIGHTGEENKIEKTFMREVVNEPVYRPIGKFDGLMAEFTGEHPILTAKIKVSRLVKDKKKRSYKFLNMEWKSAKELKRGDYICIPKARFGLQKSRLLSTNDIFKDFEYLTKESEWKFFDKDGNIYPLIRPNTQTYKPIPCEINNLSDFYWLIGLYLAEGSCGHGVVYFSLHQNEIEIIEKIRKIVKSLWGLDISVRPLIDCKTHKITKGVNVSICSMAIKNLFKMIVPGNTKERTKHLRYEKIHHQPELLNQILLGAWEGDGCKASKNQWRITTAVPHLAYLYFQLAAYQRLNPRIKKYKQASQFNSDFIFAVEWGDGGAKGNIEPLIDAGDFWCYKVKKVETRQYTGPVFNLECSPDHTYTVGTIAVHNCKSFYGYNATKEICGNTKQTGAPKTSQMLQALVYLYCFRDRFPYVKMVYYARDSGDRAEFDLTLVSEGEGKTRAAVNGVIDTRFYIENILNRYRELEQYVAFGQIPPNDYEVEWSDEKVEKRYALGEVGKTTYEKWQKGKEKIGDWQCRGYCAFRDICWGQH